MRMSYSGLNLNVRHISTLNFHFYSFNYKVVLDTKFIKRKKVTDIQSTQYPNDIV